MSYGQAAEQSVSLLTPAWYTWGNPDAAVVDTAENFYKYFWPAPTPPGTNATYTALMNAATGAATNAQIDYAASDCVQQIQNMRALAAANPGSVTPPPPNAEAGCLTTATAAAGPSAETNVQNLLSGVLPFGSSDISTWAWIALAGIAGIIALTR